MNKIVIKLYGGIGNQMFQYAFAKAYSLRNNCKLEIDSVSGFINDNYKREYLLHQFIGNKEQARFYFKNRVFQFFIYKIDSLIFKKYYINEGDDENFDDQYLKLEKTKFKLFKGYWQNPKYFNDYDCEIKRIFKIDKSILNIKTIQEGGLINSSSVALCFRFFQEVDNFSFERKRTVSYYQNSVNLILKKIENPVFFIFCNNKLLAEKFISSYLPQLGSVVFLSEKPENIMAIQDLYLLTQFENFILSYSTLHWWGAYLAENSKICIAGDACFKKIMLETWMIMPCKKQNK